MRVTVPYVQKPACDAHRRAPLHLAVARGVGGRQAPSDALVLFGVTGGLAHKMIFPALYAIVKRGTLTVPVIGVASSSWTAPVHSRDHPTSDPRFGGAFIATERSARVID